MSSILIFLLFPGEAYLHQSNLEQASRYFHVISSINPSYENYYGSAICLLKEGEFGEAVRLFEAISDEKDVILYYLGVAYYENGVYDKSALYFDSLLDVRKDVWQANYYSGLIRLKQNQIEEAMDYFDRIPVSFEKELLLAYLKDYNRLVSARQSLKEGQYELATELYENTLYFIGYRELGLAFLLVQKNEYRQSLVLLDSIINHSDDMQLINEALFRAARIYITSKEYSKAREYLERILSISSDDKAHFLLGKMYSDAAKYDSAEIHFKNLPDSVDEYLFYKGRTEYFLGLWGRAEGILLRHRESFPNSIYGDRATFILASINFKRKEYNQAIDFWQELITTYPNSVYAAAAQKGIGDAYFNKKQYNNSLVAYRMVKKYDPSASIMSRTSLRIYETLYHLKRYPKLVDALRKFVDEHPSSQLVLHTRFRIAKILFKRKAYYQSLSEFNKIIEQYPDSSLTIQALIEKARIHEVLGNQEEVKNVFGQLLGKVNAGEYCSYAAHELGIIYFAESKYDSALFHYNLLLDNKQYRERAIFEIAKIYDVLGQNNESETMINRLISEFPTSVFLFDAYMLKTKVYKSQGNYESAIELLEELIDKLGQKPEIYFEIGNIYFELEDYLNARRSYLISCEYFGQKRNDAARALLRAGDASFAIGDKKTARKHYLQAALIAESPSLKNQATVKMSSISQE